MCSQHISFYLYKYNFNLLKLLCNCNNHIVTEKPWKGSFKKFMYVWNVCTCKVYLINCVFGDFCAHFIQYFQEETFSKVHYFLQEKNEIQSD